MSVVDEIKQRLDIVEVIGEYVPLKKSGRNFKGLCPFHTEKTPSFFVFPESGTWHCFGACNTGGDIFTFIMKRENLTFGEALRFLARKAGVSLRPPSPALAAEEKLRERLRELNALAANYFHHLLMQSPKGERGREYLSRRGINQETARRFQLGYALNEWHALEGYLTGKGYSREDLVKAGLVVEREDGGVYDRFRGRLMFPIRDRQGYVIGFGARALDDSTPKYLNSPQTPLFDKSSVLYGIDLAKEAIRLQDLAVVVEGYMDVLMAHQCGFTNVVASLGTALTESQLRGLARLAGNLILALDADAAGSEATLRGLETARQTLERRTVPVPTPRGLIRYESRLATQIRVLILPPGQDPDEVIRQNPSRWETLVHQALPLVDYCIEAITSRLDISTARGKAQAVRELAPILREVGSEVERAYYIQKLARILQVNERSVWEEYRKYAYAERRGRREKEPPPPVAPEFGLEEQCLLRLLSKAEALPRLNRALEELGVRGLEEADFRNAENRQIFIALERLLAEESAFDVAHLRAELDESLRHRLDFLSQAAMDVPSLPEEKAERDALACALRLRENRLRETIRELYFLLEETPKGGETERWVRQRVNEQREELRQVQKALRSRSPSPR